MLLLGLLSVSPVLQAQSESLLLSGLDFRQTWQQLDSKPVRGRALQSLENSTTGMNAPLHLGAERYAILYGETGDQAEGVPPEGLRLAAFSSAGRILWRFPEAQSPALDRHTRLYDLTGGDGGEAAILLVEPSRYHLVSADGELQWSVAANSALAAVLSSDDTLLLWTVDAQLLRLKLSDGSSLESPRVLGEKPSANSRLWRKDGQLFGLELAHSSEPSSNRESAYQAKLWRLPEAFKPLDDEGLEQDQESEKQLLAQGMSQRSGLLPLAPIKACNGECWLLLRRPAGAETYALSSWGLDGSEPRLLGSISLPEAPKAWHLASDGRLLLIGHTGIQALLLSERDGRWGLRELWRRDYSDLAARLAEPVATRMGLVTDEGWPFLQLRGGLLQSADNLWIGASVGYGVALSGQRYQHWVKHFLLALESSDGAVLKSWPLPSALALAPVQGQSGALYLGLDGADSRTAALDKYQWLLPESIQLSPSAQGILSLSPKSYAAYIGSVIEHLRRRLSQRIDDENQRYLEAQLQSLYLLADLAHKAYWLDSSQLRKLKHWLDGSEGLLQQCMKSLDSSLHCELARQRGQALDAIIPAFRS